MLVALAAFALSPVGGLRDRPFGVFETADPVDPTNALGTQVQRVVGSDVSAKAYGEQVSAHESGAALTSDLSPLDPAAFAAPTAAYLDYAGDWAARASRSAHALTAAVASGDRGRARDAWRAAFGDYLHLGAVYGQFGGIDTAIDGLPQGEEEFTGLHRLERGLWSGESLRSLRPVAVRLEGSLAHLRRELPGVEIAPLDYSIRAHEILEDAQRHMLSGAHVQWSGEGVLAAWALLASTHEVIRTLEPLLEGRNNTLIRVQEELRRLDAVFASIRNAHDGLPALARLRPDERALLNGRMAGALAALSEVPPTLETTPPLVIPPIK